jgi:ubiquinone/menaquinone biosynthesis C-methylase UbiE
MLQSMTPARLQRLICSWLLAALLVPIAAWSFQAASITSEQIFEAIAVKEGSTICEIGAGDGALSIAAARLAGPSGRVYTNELGERRVSVLREKTAASGLGNIVVVEGEATRTNFPDETCDGVFLRDVYHHLTDPAAINASMLAALKPGGRAAVVDFTPPGQEAQQPTDRSKDGKHGVSPRTVSRELIEAGFEPVHEEISAQRWFMIIVAKPQR